MCASSSILTGFRRVREAAPLAARRWSRYHGRRDLVPLFRRARIIFECLVYLARVCLVVGECEIQLALRNVVLGEQPLCALAFVKLHELPDVEPRADDPRPSRVLGPAETDAGEAASPD